MSKPITLAKYLLGAMPEYNGHKQTELPSMSFDDIRQLCQDLEKETGESFTFELWVKGSADKKQDCGSIYRQRQKENQLILGISAVTY